MFLLCRVSLFHVPSLQSFLILCSLSAGFPHFMFPLYRVSSFHVPSLQSFFIVCSLSAAGFTSGYFPSHCLLPPTRGEFLPFHASNQVQIFSSSQHEPNIQHSPPNCTSNLQYYISQCQRKLPITVIFALAVSVAERRSQRAEAQSRFKFTSDS